MSVALARNTIIQIKTLEAETATHATDVPRISPPRLRNIDSSAAATISPALDLRRMLELLGLMPSSRYHARIQELSALF